MHNSPATDTPATITVNISSGHGTNAIKIEASPPFRFFAVNLDTDIEDWLNQVQENCKFGRLDLSNWVVYASGYLDGQPNSEWLEHKKEARFLNKTDEVMQWDYFVAWCRKHLTVLNRDKVAFDKLKLHRQTGSVSKDMSTFNLLCAQAKIPDAYRLHLWYDGLKPDVRSKTEFDQTTKQRYACVADAQSAALAVDSFYSSPGNAGTSQTGTGSGHLNRKRSYNRSTPAPAQYENMELDAPPPAKRLANYGRPNRSKPQTQPSGFVYFPLEGTVLTKDVPPAVKGLLDQISRNHTRLPDHLLIPAETGSDGKPRRPNGICWMKGCGLIHNYASCPRLVNYLQQYPKLDGQMPAEWVRPATPGNYNHGHARRR